MEGKPKPLIYKPSPTLHRFHIDRQYFVRAVMGPIGSGKSVGCSTEIVRIGLDQAPYAGLRETRWAVVRNSYPQLKTTTIKTFLDWFPEGVWCEMNWSPPIRATIGKDLPDGTRLEIEIYFISLDKPKDVAKVLSLELTGAWLNEAREIPKQILDALTGRVRRYPPKRRGGPSWTGIICDTNPPDDDHWWYRLFEIERPEGYALYKQPAGLIRDPEGPIRSPLGRLSANPAAENIENIQDGYQYYISQVAWKDPDWIRVYILGEYGTSFDGKAVYEGLWEEPRHLAKESLEVLRGLPVILGFDFGLTPACIACQLSPRGQLRVLREYVCEHGGIREFARDVVKPALANEFTGLRVVAGADPAGMAKSQVDEATCIGELQMQGIPAEPAPTNDFIPRRQAVVACLARNVEEGPGLLLDPSCVTLRKGFNGGYHFGRVQVQLAGGEPKHRDVPNKNKYSHPHDALQYAALLADREVYGAEGRRGARRSGNASWGGVA